MQLRYNNNPLGMETTTPQLKQISSRSKTRQNVQINFNFFKDLLIFVPQRGFFLCNLDFYHQLCCSTIILIVVLYYNYMGGKHLQLAFPGERHWPVFRSTRLPSTSSSHSPTGWGIDIFPSLTVLGHCNTESIFICAIAEHIWIHWKNISYLICIMTKVNLITVYLTVTEPPTLPKSARHQYAALSLRLCTVSLTQSNKSPWKSEHFFTAISFLGWQEKAAALQKWEKNDI